MSVPIPKRLKNGAGSVQAAPAQPVSLEAALQGARAKTDASRARRTSGPKTTPKQRVASAQALWRIGVQDHHPTGIAHTWPQKTVAMLKAKAAAFNETKSLKFDQFVGWCAENWSLVCSKHLKWMTREKPPLTPDIGFLIAFWDHFLRAWSEQDFGAWMTAPERTRHEQLVAKGMTAEEAAAQIGEERAVIKMREENRKAEQRVKSKAQEARQMERRAEKLGGMPVHPRSQVARRARLGEATAGLTKGAPMPKPDWDADAPLDPNWEPPE